MAKDAKGPRLLVHPFEHRLMICSATTVVQRRWQQHASHVGWWQCFDCAKLERSAAVELPHLEYLGIQWSFLSSFCQLFVRYVQSFCDQKIHSGPLQRLVKEKSNPFGLGVARSFQLLKSNNTSEIPPSFPIFRPRDSPRKPQLQSMNKRWRFKKVELTRLKNKILVAWYSIAASWNETLSPQQIRLLAANLRNTTVLMLNAWLPRNSCQGRYSPWKRTRMGIGSCRRLAIWSNCWASKSSEFLILPCSSHLFSLIFLLPTKSFIFRILLQTTIACVVSFDHDTSLYSAAKFGAIYQTPIWRAKRVDGLRWLFSPPSSLVMLLHGVPCARIKKIKANS